MKTRYKFTLIGVIGVVALVTTLMVALVSANPGSVIDFETLAEGAIVSSVSSGSGISGDVVSGSVSVFGFNPMLAGNHAMIFDSSCPPGGIPSDCSGGDDDLGTPNIASSGPGRLNAPGAASNTVALGKLLIISVDLDGGDPDDADLVGARFDFEGRRRLTASTL